MPVEMHLFVSKADLILMPLALIVVSWGWNQMGRGVIRRKMPPPNPLPRDSECGNEELRPNPLQG